MEVAETYEAESEDEGGLQKPPRPAGERQSVPAFAVKLQNRQCYSTKALGRGHRIVEDA